MKLNLFAAAEQKQQTLLTFGGAWSNHIHAVAAAGKEFGFNTIGIIRGEESVLNSNLDFAIDCGMRLVYVDRIAYRDRTQPTFIDELHADLGDFYLLPEGGSNELAVTGCSSIVDEIDEEFDVICTACGTGSTLAGIITGLNMRQSAIGYAVLKGAGFLNADISSMLQSAHQSKHWHIETGYHFGGYARVDDELFRFMHGFEKQFGIELDAIYTAKMFYGLFNDIRMGEFSEGTRIVAVHTGGTQGNAGFAGPDVSAGKTYSKNSSESSFC